MTLAVSATLLVAAWHVVRLDQEVRLRFAGARWALPAQVYAAPLELYPGLALDMAGLRRELDRIGYREVARANGPGTFAVNAAYMDIVTREFEFWDGLQPSLRLRVRFSNGTIAAIEDHLSPRTHAVVRLDPLTIGSIYPAHGEDRVLVRLVDVPPLLTQGLLLVEDRDFYRHRGISPKAIVRAALANLRAGRVVQGGSTITQQLVRNFFLTLDQTWGRKLNEAVMAMLLELHYDKHEILEAYLNEIFLGQDGDRAIHGFGLASRFYFNKPLEELETAELSLLVGLAKGASFYNPRRHPQRAKGRRDLVLRLLGGAGLLTADELETALEAPLGLRGSPRQLASRHPAFIDLVRRQLRRDYRDQDLTDDGLRIFTTLDPRAQERLEARVPKDVAEIEAARGLPSGELEAAAVVIGAHGGEVQAVVGGRNPGYAGFNRALDARRPVGSLLKPFVYLAALSQPRRYNLLSTLHDEDIELVLPHGAVWTPKNYDGENHGDVPLYLALARSYNLATVHMGLDVGVDAVLRLLRAAGYNGNAQALPSVLLGAVGMTPLEVAQVYTTLASGGYHSPLIAIREVTTREGEPLQRYPMRMRQVLPEDAVYLVNWAMEQVMIFGTGRSAYGTLSPAVRLAGKTGTTDEYRDAWFAGYAGDRIAVVWVGRDDNQPVGLSGAAGALPIWARLMRDLQARSFDPLPPGNVEEVLTDPASGLRADDGCLNAVAVPYIVGYAPEQWAPCAEARDSPVIQWFRKIFR